MTALCRLTCALLAAALAIPAMVWLALSALAMLGFPDASWGSKWMRFCACAALASAAPAAIRAWSPRTGWQGALREGSRSVLLSFAMFIAGLMLFFKPALQFAGLPMLMAPAIAENLGGALACPLFLAAWFITERLLPLPASGMPLPREMRAFSSLSFLGTWLLAGSWLIAKACSLQMPAEPFLFCGAWIAPALRRGVAGGDGCSALAWVAFCTCLAVLAAMSAAWSTAAELALTCLPLFLLLASCLALCRRPAWKWLS
ncbi:MAG: hypothetical protein J6P53_00615 [Mailhella sp.]|nr:hypothetical protein [Mailhella sp.]